jgi:hypothetical protein
LSLPQKKRKLFFYSSFFSSRKNPDSLQKAALYARNKPDKPDRKLNATKVSNKPQMRQKNVN